MNKISYILTLLMLIPSFLYGLSMADPDIQKTITISGYISDAETGERVVNGGNFLPPSKEKKKLK
jgi:hypothetical protein